LSNSYSSYRNFCQNLVKVAGEIVAKSFQQSRGAYSIKADQSHLTLTDTAVETYYLSEIKKNYPSHNIHSEESGDHNHGSDYTWYLDPLDGTSNFIFGIPLFGTMVALKYKNHIIASAINLPLLKRLGVTEKDAGVKINHQPVQLPNPIPLNQVTLFADCGKTIEAKKTYNSLLKKLYPSVRALRHYGCVANNLSLISSGHLYLCYICEAEAHDILPLSLFYQEYGLTVLNLNLKPWSVSDTTLIAFHPSLNQEILNCLK
jgi:myo-inositol-1(or 4)-monophosphatase